MTVAERLRKAVAIFHFFPASEDAGKRAAEVELIQAANNAATLIEAAVKDAVNS